MSATLAPATGADLPKILALLEACRLPGAGLADQLATTLVLRDDDAIVGSAAVELYGASGLLRSVAVDPRRRGEGWGRRLTSAALELARRRGVTTVYLLTETAGEFFPRFGFRTIARADVDPAVQHSIEFTSACPTSALAMVTSLD